MGPVAVFDLYGYEAVGSADELATVLERRSSGANHFEVSANPPAYPLLTLMVSGDLAVLHYFAGPGDAGAQSTGNLHAAPDVADFPDASGGVVRLAGDAIVDLTTARRCVEQFAETGERPDAVGWRPL